ncbi:MAG: citrate synthase [Ignavibacteriales bacterium]|nr:citrate synthase [Ignavibacteriales bacterium]
MAKDSLTITDNRTGTAYEVPIADGTINAIDLRKIKTDAEDFGLMTYDPAFMNTASVRSKITFIDGDKGILRYRGYPIEQLAEHVGCFDEIGYLLLNGELPNPKQLTEFQKTVNSHAILHENVKKIIEGFRHDAHPMGVFISTVAALSTFYPEAKNIFDQEIRRRQIYRLIAKVPIIAAYAYRHAMGLPYVAADQEMSYAANFINMMFRNGDKNYAVHPVLEHALMVLFILHADHEQNCGTNAMRAIGSSHVDPYAATAGAAAALWGPLHGGANEAVLHMLNQIGTIENVPAFIASVKDGKGKLMGFGHRVYKNFDPRATVIKRLADEVFAVTGQNPRLKIALELERIALEDEYFIKRKLYPNVDFYSGLIYQAMGFPLDFYPVLFAIPRTAGWLSQWEEHILDQEQKIARPRQIYLGYDERPWVPMDKR